MTRVNVYAQPDNDYDERTLAGWFSPESAERFDEATRWDGNNHVSVTSGSQWDHQSLYRTLKGAWVIHRWSQWQGSTPIWQFVSPDQARKWLLANHCDEAVEKYFGPIPDEHMED